MVPMLPHIGNTEFHSLKSMLLPVQVVSICGHVDLRHCLALPRRSWQVRGILDATALALRSIQREAHDVSDLVLIPAPRLVHAIGGEEGARGIQRLLHFAGVILSLVTGQVPLAHPPPRVLDTFGKHLLPRAEHCVGSLEASIVTCENFGALEQLADVHICSLVHLTKFLILLFAVHWRRSGRRGRRLRVSTCRRHLTHLAQCRRLCGLHHAPMHLRGTLHIGRNLYLLSRALLPLALTLLAAHRHRALAQE
mmetsp:Transcript_115058/g.245789  ORF Transcript_115058/g.245789 Transcript_115058/m.245789 type:complete len:252 (+) Transcript_115058:117-872(+)